MKKKWLGVGLIVAGAPAWAQDVESKFQAAIAGLDAANQSLNLATDLAGLQTLKSDLAMLQQNSANSPPFAKRLTIAVPGSGRYEYALQMLDDRRYDDAIRIFDAVIGAKADHVDGALYWKAYALNRIGRRDEALAALATLRKDYSSSHWLNDAQALEAEVQQGAGKPVSPEQQSNEDIKLMAINSLMNADPDRAVPLLETLLKSGNSPRLKDRALFVLTQSKSPKAQQILVDYAKGAGNPDLQLKAVRYIGMSGTAESQQQLGAVYASSNDVAVKKEILRSLMAAGAKDQLFNAAKNEKDADLRKEAVRQLGAMGATDHLMKLYTPDTTPELKIEIIRGLSMGRAGSADSLVSLYTADTDPKVKKELINGLLARQDAKPLIAIARKENDPTMKRYIVERLATMRNNKDATDYMMELLK
jgi:tetratricopeptide (TPR) repeat protein